MLIPTLTEEGWFGRPKFPMLQKYSKALILLLNFCGTFISSVSKLCLKETMTCWAKQLFLFASSTQFWTHLKELPQFV